MKVVKRANTNGGTIRASIHIDADTEASVDEGRDEGDSVVRIGELSIFGTNDDLELLAATISKHVRAARRRVAKSTF